jgi:putative peptide maturation system protein
MHSAFNEALANGAALLRELPRQRETLAEAHARLKDFQGKCAKTRADMYVHQAPGSARVDFDLLLEHPEGGTVALTWSADDGNPWAIQYTEHWAANYVLTVNQNHVTVQRALLTIKWAGQKYIDLMAELIDQSLIHEELEKDPLLVSEQELQTAANQFRIANQLHSADATRRWLSESGLSMDRFRDWVSWQVQADKLKERITAARVDPYFEAQKQRFDIIQVFRVDTCRADLASSLAESAGGRGLLTVTQARILESGGERYRGSLVSRFAYELAPALQAAAPGAIILPDTDGRTWSVIQVQSRVQARLDSRTRAVIRDQLFREWLAERRKEAKISWHWM